MTPKSDTDYQAALAWLFSRTRAGGERSPARAAALLARLGLTAPATTVLVTGTNGKGSVSSMIAAGLMAAGQVTGRFVSPHVESFLERISVDDQPVSEARVTEFVRLARELAADPATAAAPEPAFFEWCLALALSEFRRRGADAAVLEAGVGGAGDATRAVAGVDLVVLTNVDLDHVDVLGPTLELIAADKLGAMRSGAPYVSGVVQPPLRAMAARQAARLESPLHQYQPDQALFSLPAPLERATRVAPSRLRNARLAAAALRLLGANEDAVLAGLRAPPLPARGERFLLDGQVEVLLDGAHDPAAARELVNEIAGRPYALLFGALGKKQGPAVLQVLAERAEGVVLTEALEGEGRLHDWPGATFEPEAEPALRAALRAAQAAASSRTPAPATSDELPLLVVAGSLYLAGRVRPLLRARGQRLPAPWE